MVFASTSFIFVFLPSAITALFLVKRKYRNVVLLISSIIFYTYGEVQYGLVMLASILIDFTAAKQMSKAKDQSQKKRWLLVSIGFNLLLLATFKYTAFIFEWVNVIFNTSFVAPIITLPLGISFFTFQTMSYSIDVYTNQIKAETNIIDFAAYVSMFPQLIAGPIIRYKDIQHQIKNPELTLSNLTSGLETFIFGLASKVLLANSLAIIVSRVESFPFEQTSMLLWTIHTLAFGFQLYFDFFGYSLMAIGLGKMLGFDFKANFNYPYMAATISDFFRRWHITLGDWFKTNVYIPLKGNRSTSILTIRNIMIVWFLTGLWHGANNTFVLWGLLMGLAIVVEKNILKRSSIFSRLITWVVVFTGWSIFVSPSLTQWLQQLQLPFLSQSKVEGFLIYASTGLFLASLLFSTNFPTLWYSNQHKWVKEMITISLLLLSIASLVSNLVNPFLYFRF